MEELKTRFPDGLDYQIVYDTTPFIRESVYEVFRTLRDAVILVAIVVLVFLQNWRAALIPPLARPVPLARALAVLAGFALSLHHPLPLRPVLVLGHPVGAAIRVGSDP